MKDRNNKKLYLLTDSKTCYTHKFSTIPSLIEYYTLNPIIISKNKNDDCVHIFLRHMYITDA